jgi:hypothetical protein
MKASDINGESIKRIGKLEGRPGILYGYGQADGKVLDYRYDQSNISSLVKES